jgi:exo-1,4-beta-D-glucosaminidase
MTIYWMLNNHWPSFFGHIFDYYLRPGGAYYGAKKGLRPLSVVFDSYATGKHDHANITVVNQTPRQQTGLTVRVRVYDLQGRVRDDRSAGNIDVTPGGTAQALTLPRLARDSSVLFVRAQLLRPGRKSGLRERVLAVAATRRRWRSEQRFRVRAQAGELGGHDRAQLHATGAARRDRVQGVG